MNDPALDAESNHSEDHCADMAESSKNADKAHDICDNTCTGACCSIYLSVGMTFSETTVSPEAFSLMHKRPENDLSISITGQFPTPPPKSNI